jgi:hypothetical protein
VQQFFQRLGRFLKTMAADGSAPNPLKRLIHLLTFLR